MSAKAGASMKRERVMDVEIIKDKLKSGGVETGVLYGAGDHPNADGVSMVELAIWMEFGTWRKSGSRSGASVEWSPPRSFIKSTADDKRDEYRALQKKLLALVLKGKMTVERAESIIGMKVQSDIQLTILELVTPPNTESTIKAKKSDNPLIEDGHLQGSIKWIRFND